MNMAHRTDCLIIAMALVLALAAGSRAHADPAPSLFGESPYPDYSNPTMLGGIRKVGNWACGETSAPPPSQTLPGEWVALAQRDGDWVLESAAVTDNVATLKTDSVGARYVMQRLPELKLGKVPAATLVRSPEAHVVTIREGSWRFRAEDDLLVLEHGAQRWWIEPLSEEERAAVRAAGRGECLTDSPTCNENAQEYGIVWAGDLDGDEEPDFIFDWELTETFGLTLGLSSNPRPGAMLRLVVASFDACA